MSEQRPAMQNATPVAPRDPRLNAQIDAILAARHSDPFALLGPHPVDTERAAHRADLAERGVRQADLRQPLASRRDRTT